MDVRTVVAHGGLRRAAAPTCRHANVAPRICTVKEVSRLNRTLDRAMRTAPGAAAGSLAGSFRRRGSHARAARAPIRRRSRSRVRRGTFRVRWPRERTDGRCGDGRRDRRTGFARPRYSLKVVIAMHAVIPAGLEAAPLESAVGIRTGRGRADRASPAAPGHRARRARRVSPVFRTDTRADACSCAQKEWNCLRFLRFAIRHLQYGNARLELRASGRGQSNGVI
jgi:hypothetical protein